MVEGRLEQVGLDDNDVSLGEDSIIIATPNVEDEELIISVGTAPGELRFRPVLGSAPADEQRPSQSPGWRKRTIAGATSDDGQVIQVLNELYIGHASHRSSPYQLVLPDGSLERQSSSGILVGTGTGAAGWLSSAWTERGS